MNPYLSIAAGAALGIIGYALIIRVSARTLIPTLILGLLGTAVYLLSDHFGMSSFISNLLASLLLSIGSEFCARFVKAPAPVFLYPAIIILVPGSCLYYSISNLIGGDYPAALENALEMLRVSGGIVVGLIAGLILIAVNNDLIHRIHKRKKKSAGSRRSVKSGTNGQI